MQGHLQKIGRLSFFLILAVSLSGCIMSQSAVRKLPIRTMSGTVTDSNGVPLQGVMITTEPSTSSIATDALGRYSITAVSEGEYVVKANKIGFTPSSITINVRGFEITRADLQLIPEGLLPVTVQPEIAYPETQEDVTETESAVDDGIEDDKWWRK